jgi:uncharacterized membrane protein
MSDPFVPPSAGSNPYAAPATVVADVPGGAPLGYGSFVPAGRVVDAGRFSAWYSEGWNIFKAQPLMWIAMVVLFAICAVILNFIPLLGPVALAVLSPVMYGGFMIAAASVKRGEELDIGKMFAGFKEDFGSLAIVGAIYFACFLVLIIVVALVMGVGVAGLAFSGGRGAGGGAAFGTIMLMGLVFLIAMIPIYAALWFAPSLVVFNKLSPIEALKTSFFAFFKNIVPFIVFLLITIVLWILAAIPIGLGYLVLAPVLIGCAYAQYRDIFYA